MKKISAIVPCYKVEDYLPKCLDSIIDQTYKNLEIILVDDGSPDNCPQICEDYAKKDNRIKVVHKQNGGLSSARNAGLQVATGEYVSFIDSDDWLELDMYETLVTVIETENADIAECGHRVLDAETLKEVEPRATNSNCITSFTTFPDIVSGLVGAKPKARIQFEVWDKLFKRDLIGDLRFKVGQIYEDMYFDRIIFSRCKKIAHIDKVGYNYLINRGGSTTTFFKDVKLCKFNEIDDYISDLEKFQAFDVINDMKIYGCGAAVGLYFASKQYGGSKESRKIVISAFNKYVKGIVPYQFSFRVFSTSPLLYYYIKRLRDSLQK